MERKEKDNLGFRFFENAVPLRAVITSSFEYQLIFNYSQKRTGTEFRLVHA